MPKTSASSQNPPKVLPIRLSQTKIRAQALPAIISSTRRCVLLAGFATFRKNFVRQTNHNFRNLKPQNNFNAKDKIPIRPISAVLVLINSAYPVVIIDLEFIIRLAFSQIYLFTLLKRIRKI
jgi:hypothetical protein